MGDRCSRLSSLYLPLHSAAVLEERSVQGKKAPGSVHWEGLQLEGSSVRQSAILPLEPRSAEPSDSALVRWLAINYRDRKILINSSSNKSKGTKLTSSVSESIFSG